MRKEIQSALHYERLGEEHYFGIGRKKDPDTAKRFFCLAALCGEGEVKADALCNLAMLTREPEAKLTLYVQAAEENCAYAMNMVGICIENEFDDLESATDWFLRAAKAGSPDGMYNYARNIHSLKERIRYLERAAELQHEPSIRLLAKLRADEEARKAEERKKVLQNPAFQRFRNDCFQAARKWAGKPAAIVSLSTPLAVSSRNQFIYDVAEELKQSILVLFDDMEGNSIPCVGCDFGKVGLARAMENPYLNKNPWAFGSYTIGDVSRENKELFCEAVELALEKSRE